MWSEEQLFYENNSQGGEVTREREKKNTRILEALNENGGIHDIGRNH